MLADGTRHKLSAYAEKLVLHGQQIEEEHNTHVNNPFKRVEIRHSVESAGYVCPETCSPEELVETEDE